MESFKKNPLKDLALLNLAAVLVAMLIWLPHILGTSNFFGLDFGQGFNSIYRNFDGLEYVIIAKTFYNPEAISALPQSMPDNYYASHFPFYSILIFLFAPLLGFLKSMLFVSLIFTMLAMTAFYFLVKDFKLTNHPVFLSLLFLALPARWLVVHSVGSSEPIFIFFVITTLYFFLRYEADKKFSYILLAGISGAFAQLTRPPGTLLFLALGIYLLWQFIRDRNLSGNFIKQMGNLVQHYYPLLLMPATLLGIFYWFQFSYGDFWAYFHSGDNIHLSFPPFQVFNKHQFWVGDIWLEDIIYIFLIGIFGGIILLKQKLYPIGIFVLTYFTASLFVAHRDISRYTLPAFPFIIIAFEKILTSKEFRIAFMVVFLGIYLYAQNFIIENVAPFPNPNLFN